MHEQTYIFLAYGCAGLSLLLLAALSLADARRTARRLKQLRAETPPDA